MANELATHASTGSSVHTVIRDSDLLIWNGSDFVAEVDADWPQYVIDLTEQGDTGFFYADFPVDITTAGNYAIEFFSGAGTINDTFITGGILSWDGSSAIFDDTGTALTSLNYVKQYIGITVATYDVFLNNAISVASQVVSSWCHREFPINNYTEYHDGAGSTTLQLTHYPVTAITSITLDVNSSDPTVIPTGDIVTNSRTGLVSVKETATSAFSWFPYDRTGTQQNIKVIYAAGYNTIPLDIQGAVAEIVKVSYNLLGADNTLDSEKIGDYSYSGRICQTIPPWVQQTLFPYKELVV